MESVHQNRVVESNITMYNTTTQSFTPPYKILVQSFSLKRKEIFNYLFQHLFLHSNFKTSKVLQNCFAYCYKTIYNK